MTRYNICPRIKRASRKSTAIGIFVGVLVAFVTLVISSYINYLISIRGERDKQRSDLLILQHKIASSMNNSWITDDFLINNENQKKDEVHNRILTIFQCILLFIFILILIILILKYLTNCSLFSINRKKNDERKQSVLLPVIAPTSAMTQTSI